VTILNESGVADVLSPLHAMGDLTTTLPGMLVVVAGTRSEAYLAHALPPVLSTGDPAVRDPHVLSLVLDPSVPPQGGHVASRLVEAAAGVRGTRAVMLVAGRSAAALGVDAPFEARLAARRLEIPVLVVSPEHDDDAACLSTDLEDRALAALLDLCRVATPEVVDKGPAKRGRILGGIVPGRRSRSEEEESRRRPVVLLGASSGELRAELERIGVEVAGSVPPPAGELSGLPPIGEGTVVAVVGPHLVRSAEAARERGAEVVKTLSPIGVDGTARFLQDVAAAAGTPSSEVSTARSVWESLERPRSLMRGKRIFFAGDTGLEIPVARSLVDAGAVVLEVGAPRLDRRFLFDDLQALGHGVDVVEAPDWWGQIQRIEEVGPDLVVASPGLYAPLVARGHLCRSSLELRRMGIYGYEGARRLLSLFVRSLERADALDSLDL
jgi:light-independent protochlorophyllide reductase subunit N